MKERLIQGLWICVIIGAVAYLVTHPEKVGTMVGSVIDFGETVASALVTFLSTVVNHF